MSKRRIAKEPRRFWTDADRAQLQEIYPNLPTAKVAQILSRSVSSISGMADLLGIHKSEEFLNSPESGRFKKGQTRPGCIGTQFPKGNVPANKGLRRPGWAPGRMKETQFKKGARSGKAKENWQPIGTIRPDGEGYLRIKVREAVHGKEPTGFGNSGVWPMLNRHVWEQHHGPIAPGHAVCFKDGNRSNCGIENLELVSRASLARRNSMWTNYPPELTQVIVLQGALKRKLRRLNHGEEKQA